MNLTIESIHLDAGMRNAQGIVSVLIGDKPVRLSFSGSVAILYEPEFRPPLVEIAEPFKPARAKKGRKKKPVEIAQTPKAMGWNEAILQALEGGNLTTNELLDHCIRIRGLKVHSPGDRKAELSRLSVAAATAKKAGLIERVEENGLDKWRATRRKAV
jgi:hypothetical protein